MSVLSINNRNRSNSKKKSNKDHKEKNRYWKDRNGKQCVSREQDERRKKKSFYKFRSIMT